MSITQLYPHISWSAPYLDLYLDLTLEEHLNMHFRFKKCLLDDEKEVMKILQLEKHKHKKLRYYSSGMLQRAKVGLALFTQTPILLLDEPTSNMDTQNADKILTLIEENLQNRIFILASNMEREYQSFPKILSLSK